MLGLFGRSYLSRLDLLGFVMTHLQLCIVDLSGNACEITATERLEPSLQSAGCPAVAKRSSSP
jgi:hypothetical protein